jgi:hypothetical protein
MKQINESPEFNNTKNVIVTSIVTQQATYKISSFGDIPTTNVLVEGVRTLKHSTLSHAQNE